MPIETKDLKLVAYELNKPIINIASQTIFLTLCGFALMTYIRNYLATKRHPRRHKAFCNILDYSGEYMLEGWISMLSLLAFPTLYQIKILTYNGLADLTTSQGFNLIFTAFLLIAPICLFIYHLATFSPKAKRYSVLYY